MCIAILLGDVLEIFKRVEVNEVEGKAVRDDVLPCHALYLVTVVVAGVCWVVATKIFIETDSHLAVSNDNALTESAYLSIEDRNWLVFLS